MKGRQMQTKSGSHIKLSLLDHCFINIHGNLSYLEILSENRTWSPGGGGWASFCISFRPHGEAAAAGPQTTLVRFYRHLTASNSIVKTHSSAITTFSVRKQRMWVLRLVCSQFLPLNLWNMLFMPTLIIGKGPHCLFVAISAGWIPACAARTLPVSLAVRGCLGEQLVTDGNSAGGMEESIAALVISLEHWSVV